MRITFTLLALCCVASTAFGQATDSPKDASSYVGESELQSIIQSVPVSKGTGKPGSFSKRLFRGGTFMTSFIRLSEPDQPHAHGTWSEIFVVKDGAGVLETGGTITGKITGDSATHKSIFLNNTPPPSPTQQQAMAAQRMAEGDKAGTDIEGGHKQNVRAGDVILIPAGVAHRWVKVDQPVVYLDIKFPKSK